MLKIIITGSHGFIGSRLLNYLKEKQYDVVGVEEDVRNKETLRPYFKDAEFVIHAAAQTKETKDIDLYYQTNVDGTKNVVELCIENETKLIHLGTVARQRHYGVSKQQAQKVVEDNIKNGLKAVSLILCAIYPGGERNDEKRYPLEKLISDIEEIIRTHDYNDYKLIKYPK